MVRMGAKADESACGARRAGPSERTPKCPLRIAMFPDRTHPYESLFSLKLKVCTWNSISEAQLVAPFRERRIVRSERFVRSPEAAPGSFEEALGFGTRKLVLGPPKVRVGPPDLMAMLKAFQLPPNLHLRTPEALFGDFHVPEVVDGGVRICPRCFSLGYHFPLFQLQALDRCPQHGVRLRSLEPPELSLARYPVYIAAPPAQPGKKNPWASGYVRPATAFRCEKIVSATDFVRAMVAHRKHLVGKALVAEVTHFEEDDTLRFATLTGYRKGSNDCAVENFCAALVHYGSADGQAPSWLTIPPFDRVTMALPDSLRGILRLQPDACSIQRTRLYWHSVKNESLHRHKGSLVPLVERYADVGAALHAWSRALQRFRHYFERRHGHCLTLHRAAGGDRQPCVDSDAFIRMWHSLTQPPEAQTMFRMAAEDMAVALSRASALRRLPTNALVPILGLILAYSANVGPRFRAMSVRHSGAWRSSGERDGNTVTD